MPARRNAVVLDPPATPTTDGTHDTEPLWSAVGSPVWEPVEVRSELVDGVPTPAQLLRDNRLWLVKWAEPLAGPSTGWRVGAAPGPGVPPALLELTVRGGRWSLVELSAASGEPRWE